MTDSASSNHNSSQDIFKLIQPDLLSLDELVNILKEKGVQPDLLSHDKYKLVALFRRVAVPLPQRDLRDNYRGRLLAKLRKKFERNRINSSGSTENNLKSFTFGVAGSSALQKETNKEKLISDRLKPPPDQINYERRKIRLSSGSSSSETRKISTDLDKLVIKKRKTSESSTDSLSNRKSSTEENKEQKPVIVTESMTTSVPGKEVKDTCNGNKSSPAPKKVTLKRNHLFLKTDKSATDVSSDKGCSESEKKRKPPTITWP